MIGKRFSEVTDNQRLTAPGPARRVVIQRRRRMNTGASGTLYPTDEYAVESHKHWVYSCQVICAKNKRTKNQNTSCRTAQKIG